MRLFIFAAFLINFFLISLPAFAQNEPANGNFGEFKGSLITQWHENGREMTLAEVFGFIDADNQNWEVPKGTVVNGASIPRAMWSIIGGPFAGKYRRASVIHDYFCIVKSKSWKEVHRMFYNAMMTSGVGKKKAQIMYAAVYHFGPRWERKVRSRSLTRGRSSNHTPAFNKKRFQQIIRQAAKSELSLADIEKLAK